MLVFTAKRLKEARNLAGMSQDEAANAMKISRRRLQTTIENEIWMRPERRECLRQLSLW